jgi:hypothetical protein
MRRKSANLPTVRVRAMVPDNVLIPSVRPGPGVSSRPSEVKVDDLLREDDMARFMVLYRSQTSAEEQMANADPAQAQAGMDAWMAWAKEAGEAVVDLGMPLGRGRHLEGSQVTPSDTDAAGYSILQADSLDEVAKLLERHPHLTMPLQNSIDVLPILAMPGT